MLICTAGAIFTAVPPPAPSSLQYPPGRSGRAAGAAGNPRRLQRFQRPAGGSFSTRFAF